MDRRSDCDRRAARLNGLPACSGDRPILVGKPAPGGSPTPVRLLRGRGHGSIVRSWPASTGRLQALAACITRNAAQ
ncbi:hypothetical protein XabCFBP2524_13765 [Xanthomonas axonopodis pv. begoniae]|nr:hypothetical protein XabCFBP2524_13765 [Xanthomonas axonopodis pv. begoniae]